MYIYVSMYNCISLYYFYFSVDDYGGGSGGLGPSDTYSSESYFNSFSDPAAETGYGG